MQPNVLESFASISSGIKRANKAIALHKTVEPTKTHKYCRGWAISFLGADFLPDFHDKTLITK